jgi:hypothetical protein
MSVSGKWGLVGRDRKASKPNCRDADDRSSDRSLVRGVWVRVLCFKSVRSYLHSNSLYTVDLNDSTGLAWCIGERYGLTSERELVVWPFDQ